MRTISGKIESSKPASLSKAAKVVSAFVAVNNGASAAVSVYLHRTSEAFNKLVDFHKDLKTPHSNRKHQSSESVDYGVTARGFHSNGKSSEVRAKRKKNRGFVVENEVSLKIQLSPDRPDEHKGERDLRIVGGDKDNHRLGLENEETIKTEKISDGVEGKRKKKKHRKEKTENEELRETNQIPDEVKEDEGIKVLGESGSVMKIKHEGVEQGPDGIEEGSANKKGKKKRKTRDGEEMVKILEDESGKNEEMKRKSDNVGDGETIDLAEQSGKKRRKRRKTEGD